MTADTQGLVLRTRYSDWDIVCNIPSSCRAPWLPLVDDSIACGQKGNEGGRGQTYVHTCCAHVFMAQKCQCTVVLVLVINQKTEIKQGKKKHMQYRTLYFGRSVYMMVSHRPLNCPTSWHYSHSSKVYAPHNELIEFKHWKGETYMKSPPPPPLTI